MKNNPHTPEISDILCDNQSFALSKNKVICGMMTLYTMNLAQKYEKTIQIYTEIKDHICILNNYDINYFYATRDYIIALSALQKFKNVITTAYQLFEFVAHYSLYYYEEILLSLDIIYAKYCEALNHVIKDKKSHHYKFAKSQLDIINNYQIIYKDHEQDVEVVDSYPQNLWDITDEVIA